MARGEGMSEEYTPNRKRNKAGMKAPCAFEVWSEPQQKNVTRYPNVSCAKHCDTCGWNPAVAQRRIDRICGRNPE